MVLTFAHGILAFVPAYFLDLAVANNDDATLGVLRIGRWREVFVERDAQGQVWIGGDVVACIAGQVQL